MVCFQLGGFLPAPAPGAGQRASHSTASDSPLVTGQGLLARGGPGARRSAAEYAEVGLSGRLARRVHAGTAAALSGGCHLSETLWHGGAPRGWTLGARGGRPRRGGESPCHGGAPPGSTPRVWLRARLAWPEPLPLPGTLGCAYPVPCRGRREARVALAAYWRPGFTGSLASRRGGERFGQPCVSPAVRSALVAAAPLIHPCPSLPCVPRVSGPGLALTCYLPVAVARPTTAFGPGAACRPCAWSKEPCAGCA
jgi:hypothetical protein